jgi:hypothetical protein
MRYGPWPQSGRLLRHLCFFFLLPALSQSWRSRPWQGGTHCVQWGGMERLRDPLPWPRQDYIAPPEEEENAPQQSAAACGCQGPATAMVPAAMADGQGKEHAPAPGARQHPAQPVKDHSTYNGAQRPARGVGPRGPTLHARPRLCRCVWHPRHRIQPHGQSAAAPVPSLGCRGRVGAGWSPRAAA